MSWAERDLPLQELQAVAAAYDPAASGFRFRALFLNAVGDPAQRVRPPGVEVRARRPRQPARLGVVLLRLTVPQHLPTKGVAATLIQRAWLHLCKPTADGPLRQFFSKSKRAPTRGPKSAAIELKSLCNFTFIIPMAGTPHADRPCFSRRWCAGAEAANVVAG